MSLPGELTVRLAWDGRRVVRVDVESTRPLIAGRLVAGKPAAEAALMLPRLYSICGHAQNAAARSALDAAAGLAPAPEALAARATAVVLETIQEYLWRLLIDWPRAMARSPVVAAVAAVRQRIAPALQRGWPAGADRVAPALVAALEALADEHVYGEPVDAWLNRADAAAFDGWIAAGTTLPARLQRELMDTAPQLGRSATMLMPAATAALLQQAVVPSLRGDPSFARAPYWQGMTAETGALARTRSWPLVAALADRDGHTVATRMAARLAELALLLRQARRPFGGDGDPRWVEAFALGRDEGLAAVQTARGLLLHRARLDDGRVADYQVVAPTEWNFHPAGPLVQGLEGAEAPDAAVLERHARLAVQALDPCVACNIEVGHA
ncbi:MAG: nickel-dependent hydrogenase large subunit [Betaproteobacteria bacterium]|nr:nickel-dependent hydrogenase large subunit [Betaproteobacteria bacterium]